MSDITTTIHNERVKLSATFFNGFAIAMVAVGGIAPVISFLTEASAEPKGSARGDAHRAPGRMKCEL